MSDAGKSWQERAWRKRLGGLLRQEGLLRGSVCVRRRVCGKPGCRCAQGDRHEAMYVTYRERGRNVQLHVPKDWEKRVRGWVKRCREAHDLLNRISGLCEAKIRQRG
ncbi:MAG TPA: hypothetical protein P5137_18270 [Candidatus Brocadiia bacterium]|nr:hypothetical protein [Candidatus Brocadiia bacterium]